MSARAELHHIYLFTTNRKLLDKEPCATAKALHNKAFPVHSLGAHNVTIYLATIPSYPKQEGINSVGLVSHLASGHPQEGGTVPKKSGSPSAMLKRETE